MRYKYLIVAYGLNMEKVLGRYRTSEIAHDDFERVKKYFDNIVSEGYDAVALYETGRNKRKIIDRIESEFFKKKMQEISEDLKKFLAENVVEG